MINQKGLTLVELIIGVAISAVVGVLLINLVIFSNNIFFNQTVKVNQGMSLNQGGSEITDLIKSSAGISNQYPPTGSAQYTADANSLILKLPSLAANGGIIESSFDYAVIEADTQAPAILRKRVFISGGSSRNEENKVLATSLKDLVLVYLDENNNPITAVQASRITFTISLYDANGELSNSSSLSGTVNLKNL